MTAKKQRQGKHKQGKQKKPANVDISDIDGFIKALGVVGEDADLMKKLYGDPDGATEAETEALMAVVERLSGAEESLISPQDRANAAAKAARAWQLYRADDSQAALDIAEEALDLNPQEPVADFVCAVQSLLDSRDLFEAMCSVSLQIDFELRRANDASRTALLKQVGELATFYAGIAAYNTGHFESAIGPLATLIDQGTDETGAAVLFLSLALIGAEQETEALDLISGLDDPHPALAWGKVLALLGLDRSDEAASALKDALAYAPNVHRILLSKSTSENQPMAAGAAHGPEAQASEMLQVLLQARKGLRKKFKALKPAG